MVRALLASGAALGLGAVVTLAAFTDDATFGTTFTTGNVDLTLNANQGTTAEPYQFSDWSSSLLTPDSAVYATLTVANSGTLAATYTMSAPVFDSGESVALQTAIIAGVRTAATCDAAGYEAGTVVAADGPLNALAITTPRPLAATNGSEVLCFMAVLPSTATGAVQGATVTPLVTFTATQA